MKADKVAWERDCDSIVDQIADKMEQSQQELVQHLLEVLDHAKGDPDTIELFRVAVKRWHVPGNFLNAEGPSKWIVDESVGLRMFEHVLDDGSVARLVYFLDDARVSPRVVNLTKELT